MDDSSSQDELMNENHEENLNLDDNESKNKTILFNFLSRIIGEEIIPFPLRFAFYIVEIFQILSLAFNSQVISFINNICNEYSFSPYGKMMRLLNKSEISFHISH